MSGIFIAEHFPLPAHNEIWRAACLPERGTLRDEKEPFRRSKAPLKNHPVGSCRPAKPNPANRLAHGGGRNHRTTLPSFLFSKTAQTRGSNYRIISYLDVGKASKSVLHAFDSKGVITSQALNCFRPEAVRPFVSPQFSLRTGSAIRRPARRWGPCAKPSTPDRALPAAIQGTQSSPPAQSRAK